MNFKKTQHIDDNPVNIDKITFEKLKHDAYIIDVRDPEEFAVLRKIPEAINIPYHSLIANPKKYIPSKATTVITICNAGNRSTAAACALKQLGYKNAYVLGCGIYGYYRSNANFSIF